MLIHPDRLFPAEATSLGIARSLYEEIRALPIVSPHGHTQASWFALNQPFPDPAQLFVQPDHYVFRMLYSQGVSLEDLEIGQPSPRNPREVWRIFARHYYLFRGTPTRLWLDFAFQELFGMQDRLSGENADRYFDSITEQLHTAEFLPCALYDRFHVEVLATTDSPLDSLADHKAIRESSWKPRIIPTLRPDPVVDPEFPGFSANLKTLAEQTGEDTSAWPGYLNAPDVKNTEPHLYFYLRLLHFYQGQLTAEAVLPPPPTGPEDIEGELAFDTVSYDVGNWHLYHHNLSEAVDLFRKVVKGEVWNSWGFIGSEVELLRTEK